MHPVTLTSYDFLESEIQRMIFIQHVLTVQWLEIELIYIDDEEKDTIHPRVFVLLYKYIAILNGIVA